MCEEIHPILTFACVCVSTTYSPPNIKSGTVTTVHHNNRTGRKYNKGHNYIFLTTITINKGICTKRYPPFGVRLVPELHRALFSSLRQTVAF